MSTATKAVKLHSEAINERDVEVYLGSTNFPFTYQNYNGVSLTIGSADAYGAEATPWPWEIILDTDPTWDHTTFDIVEEVVRSVSSAVFLVTISRVDAEGSSYGTFRALWIATERDGHWGIQFRHNLGAFSA
jgi:hypothetical protein